MPSLDVSVSWGTLALTKDGSQKKRKVMGELAKIAHCRRGQIEGHIGSSNHFKIRLPERRGSHEEGATK